MIFKNFAEFWYYTRGLSKNHREIILKNLPKKERDMLIESYKDEGWEDVFIRDILDSFKDTINRDYHVDILRLRCRALMGENLKISKDVWLEIYKYLSAFDSKHTFYLIGNLCVTELDSDTFILSTKDRR